VAWAEKNVSRIPRDRKGEAGLGWIFFDDEGMGGEKAE